MCKSIFPFFYFFHGLNPFCRLYLLFNPLAGYQFLSTIILKSVSAISKGFNPFLFNLFGCTILLSFFLLSFYILLSGCIPGLFISIFSGLNLIFRNFTFRSQFLFQLPFLSNKISSSHFTSPGTNIIFLLFNFHLPSAILKFYNRFIFSYFSYVFQNYTIYL